MNTSLQAEETQSTDSLKSSDDVMGLVEYALPHELGSLVFHVPLHWDGARSEHVEALWIDTNKRPFKDNVTLRVIEVKDGVDPEAYLDENIKDLIEDVAATAVSEVKKAPAHRLISLDRTFNGLEITQTVLLIYVESGDKGYRLSLTYGRLQNQNDVDLGRVTAHL